MHGDRACMLVAPHSLAGLDDSLRIGEEEKPAIHDSSVERKRTVELRLTRQAQQRHIPYQFIHAIFYFFMKLGRTQFVIEILFPV